MAESQEEYQIGSIVTLKAHFARGNKKLRENISISGDDKSIPPYMMVIETLKETKNKYDEQTGENTIKKDTYRLKVVWFNARTYKFNKEWINSSFVDVIKSSKKTSKLKSKKGSQVVLKTNPLEIKKKRVSIKEENWGVKTSKANLLTFCAPEMVVIGKSKFKPKDPIFDKVTHEEIRKIPNDQLKCQYYNPITDKYSEIILPIECFESAYVETDKLNQLIDASQNDQKLVGFNEQLYRIKNTSYLHGIYMIQSENFVDETEKFFTLNEIKKLTAIDIEDVLGEKLAPRWEGNNYNKISDFIDKDAIKHKDYLDKNEKEKINLRPIFPGGLFYISYRNLKGKFTNRFIKIESVSIFPIKEEKENGAKGMMVKAFCFLRNGERTFTFTDERLLAIYEVKIELDTKEKNKLNIGKLLNDLKEKNKKKSNS